jgi:hypothetical protein
MPIFFLLMMRGGWNHKRQAGQRNPGHGSRRLGILCSLVASFAALALLVPGAAMATSKSKLISEAKLSMRVETKSFEARHLIPYSGSTTFIVNCTTIAGSRIRCREHHGPARCVNSKPWTELTDIFPVIKGRVGVSLDGGPITSSVYCPKTH